MTLTTTSSFRLSTTAKHCLQMKSRSLSFKSRGKLVFATISNLRRLAQTEIIFTFSPHSRLSTQARPWYESSKASLSENYSNAFPRSAKTSGVVSSGAMVSIFPPSASGGIGQRSNNMSQIKGRRCLSHLSSNYSHKAMRQVIPRRLAAG